MSQSKLCESPALGSACCACEKTTQDFFFFFFPFQGDKWERGSASETLCWTNISHWSTPSLRYWYSLQSLDPGYKTHPLSSCSSWMAGSSYTPPLLQTHTQTHTHTHTPRSPSLPIPLSLSAAASGVWAGIDEAYFWSHYFSHARLILRFIKQDLGWRRTLASADHSLSSPTSVLLLSPLRPVVFAGGNGWMVHCRLNLKTRKTRISN